MLQSVWDLEKCFLLPQFAIFSPENEQLALLWDENDTVGNWCVWFNTGGNTDGLQLALHPLFRGRRSMLLSVWDSNICFILRIEIRKVAKILRTDSLEEENSIVTSVKLSQHSLLSRERLFSWFHGLQHQAWCLYTRARNAIFLQGWSVFQICT